MRFAKSTAALCAVAAFLAACDEPASPPGLEAPAPSHALIDGSTSGEQPVYFLPPLASDPDVSDDFNGGLAPSVVICEQSAATEAGCPEGAELIRFGPDEISVEDDHYHVNFRVRGSGAELGTPYSIFVMLGDLPMASVDIVVVANGSKAKGVTAGVPIGANQTLPIKFFMGDVFAPEGGLDYYGGTLDSEGGTATTSTGGAAFYAPEGWIDPELGPVNFFIVEREATEEDPCLPEGLVAGEVTQQFETCYDFFTVPAVGEFNEPAIVGQCMSPAAHDLEDHVQIAAFHEDGTLEFLANTAAPFDLACESFAYLTRDGSLGSYAAALGRKALDLFAAPLVAGHHGLGGLTKGFSDHAWVLRVYLDVASGDDQTTTPGTAPAEPLVALAQSRHTEDADGDGVADPGEYELPFPGLAVTFTVLNDDGGEVATYETDTDASGEASYSPVLTDPGDYTVVASGDGALSDAVFSLTVEAPPAPTLTLLSPTAGDVIPQNDPTIGCSLLLENGRGFGFQVVYDWTDVPGATGYEIVAGYPGYIPFVNHVTVAASELIKTSCNSIAPSTITAEWQVRPLFGGTPGAWSAIETFDFGPCLLEDGSSCFAGTAPIGFEVLPDGSDPGYIMDVTNQYAGLGVLFSFEALDGTPGAARICDSTVWLPAGSAEDHSVTFDYLGGADVSCTPASLGTITMTITPAVQGVRFKVAYPGASSPTIVATLKNGDPAPVTALGSTTYTAVYGGVQMTEREYAVSWDVDTIALSHTSAMQFIDDVRLFLP